MNHREVSVIVRNAMSNVLRGASATLVAVLLPPFLTRALAPDAFGAWSLILQLAAYVNYLDFGVQTAVARFVAHARERKARQEEVSIVSTAFALLLVSGVVGLALVCLAAALLPRILPGMPSSLTTDARIAFLLVGSSLSVGLPISVFSGVAVGLQRNEVAAVIVGGSKLFGALLLIVVAKRGASLAEMGLVLAAVNISSCAVQYYACRRIAPETKILLKAITRGRLRELSSFCTSLSIWLFGMLMVSGLDLALVGYFQFQAVAYYAVAMSAVAAVIGVQNAVFGAVIQGVAVLHARNDDEQLGRFLVHSTRLSSLLLLAMSLPLMFGGKLILSWWVGRSYAAHVEPILILLVAANLIRLLSTPFATLLIGTGQQRLASRTVLVEGLVNVMLSAVLGYRWGALGVAAGTLFSAPICLVGHILYNMPRIRGAVVDRMEFVREGLWRPLMCAVPGVLTVVACWKLYGRLSPYASALGGLQFVVAAWIWGLRPEDRSFMRNALLRLRLAPARP